MSRRLSGTALRLPARQSKAGNAWSRRRKFAAATVRKRLHDAGEHPYVTSDKSADYQAHSAALHVNPHVDLAAPLGCTDGGGWNGNVGFAEIFEHADGLLVALRRLTEATSPNDADVCDRAARSLPKFRAGMSRSHWSPTTMLLRVAARMQRESDNDTQGRAEPRKIIRNLGSNSVI
jgi:hypothetical protein